MAIHYKQCSLFHGSMPTILIIILLLVIFISTQNFPQQHEQEQEDDVMRFHLFVSASPSNSGNWFGNLLSGNDVNNNNKRRRRGDDEKDIENQRNPLQQQQQQEQLQRWGSRLSHSGNSPFPPSAVSSFRHGGAQKQVSHLPPPPPPPPPPQASESDSNDQSDRNNNNLPPTEAEENDDRVDNETIAENTEENNLPPPTPTEYDMDSDQAWQSMYPPPPPPPLPPGQTYWGGGPPIYEQQQQQQQHWEQWRPDMHPPPPPYSGEEPYPDEDPYYTQNQPSNPEQAHIDINVDADSSMDTSTNTKDPPPPPDLPLSSNQHPNNVQDETIIMQSLQYQLDSSKQRELDLCHRIDNLTSSLIEANDLALHRLHRIDLLSERIADADARAASASNQALEHQSNSTNLARELEQLRFNISEQIQISSELQNERLSDIELIEQLKENVQMKTNELEELAAAIETDRVDFEREMVLEDIRRRKRRKHNNLWFFGWMMRRADNVDDDHGRLKAAQELARSTLLLALQDERENVEELELALSTLQQNNSAISDMVASRDSLITELNDRVAVFEEDKVVLKAALRQLQKEMKEEAPKTQKMIDDLKLAKNHIKKLKESMDTLQSAHTEEISSYQHQIDQKNTAINETESKMSMIGIYVDQLEERLTSFAMARRDIDIREEKCKELEEDTIQKENHRMEIEQKMKDLTIEMTDMKQLIELMIQERSELRSEKMNLEQIKIGLEEEISLSKVKWEDLNHDMELLSEESLGLRSKLDHVTEIRDQLEETVLGLETELNETLDALATAVDTNKELSELLEEKEEEQNKLMNDDDDDVFDGSEEEGDDEEVMTKDFIPDDKNDDEDNTSFDAGSNDFETMTWGEQPDGPISHHKAIPIDSPEPRNDQDFNNNNEEEGSHDDPVDYHNKEQYETVHMTPKIDERIISHDNRPQQQQPPPPPPPPPPPSSQQQQQQQQHFSSVTGSQLGSQAVTTTTPTLTSSSSTVRFRQVRKAFARATGVHGFFDRFPMAQQQQPSSDP